MTTTKRLEYIPGGRWFLTTYAGTTLQYVGRYEFAPSYAVLTAAEADAKALAMLSLVSGEGRRWRRTQAIARLRIAARRAEVEGRRVA